MPTKKPEPGAGGRLAEALARAMPAPKPKRGKKVMTSWTSEEYSRVAAAAALHGRPFAAFVRELALAAVETLRTNGNER